MPLIQSFVHKWAGSLLLASLLATPVLAQEELQPHRNERDYIIEVLVFTQVPGANTTEKPGRAHRFDLLERTALPIGPSPAWARLTLESGPNYEPVAHQLTREATALQRSRDYRLLFHEAWRMPVTAEERSLPLLIEGGQYYDGQPELQGQLKISVARYLHMETDLYFNRFETLPEAARGSVDELLQNSLGPLQLSTPPLAGLLQPQSLTADNLRDGSSWVEGRYQVTDSARMHQRRRMRSNELHFIDSPYMGLLIRIDRAPEREESQPSS